MIQGPTEVLRGLTVCYVSTEAYGGVWRTYKQALSLADAGARVIIAGFEGSIPEPLMRRPFAVVSVRRPFSIGHVLKHPVLFAEAALTYIVNRVMGREWRQQRPPATQRYRQQLLSDAVGATGADVVQAVDLVSLRCAHQAARRLAARLVYASNELWSAFLQNPDLGVGSKTASDLLAIERTLIGDADLIISVSESMSDRLVEQYGIPRPLVLLNSPPAKVDVARDVSTPVRLVFHGGLSRDRNLEGLIQAMVPLRDKATLDIYGYSRTVDPQSLSQLIDRCGLKDTVTLHGAFDYERVVDMLKLYDLGVMANKPVDDNFEIALPNKVFDCMCSGLAIAMSESEALNVLLDDVAYGVTLDPSSPESIADCLTLLVSEPERIKGMKAVAVDAAPDHWWPVQGRKLVEAFERIAKARREESSCQNHIDMSH